VKRYQLFVQREGTTFCSFNISMVINWFLQWFNTTNHTHQRQVVL